MDTQVADRPEIQIPESGEAQPLQFDAPGIDRLGSYRPLGDTPHARPPSSAKPKGNRRNALMVNACTVAVLVAGAGAFWISSYNHYHFADASRLASHARDMAMNALPGARAPAPVAPAARLARAPEPTRAPLPSHPPVAIKSPASDGGDDMALFLKLGGQSPAAAPQSPAPVTPAPATTPDVALATAPATSPATIPVAPVKTAPQIVSSQTAATPTATAAPVAAAPTKSDAAAATPEPAIPADPVAKVAVLQAAPMSDATQLQVLQLVTQLGTLIRDQRAEIAQLRSDEQTLTQRVGGSLTDFGRRLSLAEARGAMNAAMGAAATSISMAAPQPAPASNGVTPVVARTSSAQAAADTATHRYHVQAASPGMAMLSELDSSGGEERQVPVGPGELLPGYGKVVSISQQGAAWVVKTDHGSIQ
jgi:hypothetical protein